MDSLQGIKIDAFEKVSVIVSNGIVRFGKGEFCYVTAGTFARRGLSSTAKTLRSLVGVRGSEY